jgi:hypothetical protein
MATYTTSPIAYHIDLHQAGRKGHHVILARSYGFREVAGTTYMVRPADASPMSDEEIASLRGRLAALDTTLVEGMPED